MEEASDFLVVPVVYHSLVTTAHPSPFPFLLRLSRGHDVGERREDRTPLGSEA